MSGSENCLTSFVRRIFLVIEGYVERIVYRRSKGYTVLIITAEEEEIQNTVNADQNSTSSQSRLQ